MIDISGIEYDFLPSVLWVVGIIVVGVALFVLGEVFDLMALGIPGFLLMLLGFTLGPILGIFGQAAEYVESEEKRIAVEQLTEQGYSNIDLDLSEKKFTASEDGRYVRGVLYPLSDYKYEVAEIPAKSQ